MANIPAGAVLIESDNPRLSVLSSLGTVKPRVTSNYGGWQVTARQKEIGLTDWVGRDPIKVEFDVIFDNFKSRQAQAVERNIRALERMGGLYIEDPIPPRLTVDGGGAIPHDNSIAPRRRWVIETLTEDAEYIERNFYGNRIRTRFDIVIMQYVADSKLARLPTARRIQKDKNRKKKQKGGRQMSFKKIHTVEPRETLTSIARDELGAASRWDEIADLNGIRDPRSVYAGQIIKLP